MIKYIYKYKKSLSYIKDDTLKIKKGENITKNFLAILFNTELNEAQIGLISRVNNEFIYIIILREDFDISDYNLDEYEEECLVKLLDKNIINKNLIININNITDYISITQGIMSLKYENRILFRGQANSTWILQPSLYRGKFSESREKDIYKEYIKYNSNNKNEGALDIIINMQHAEFPTRLLDWTDNPLNALFFALSDMTQLNNDSKIYCIIPNELYDFNDDKYRVIQTFMNTEFNLEKIRGNDKENEIIEFISSIAKRYDGESKFIFIEPPFQNDRIKAQKGLFSIYIRVNNDLLSIIKEKELISILGEKGSNLIEKLMYEDISDKSFEEIKIYIEYESEERMKKKDLEDISKKLYESKILKFKLENKMDFTINDRCIEIIIPSECKLEMLRELDNLNINNKSIYPDNNGLKKHIEYKSIIIE